jgi:hypothetical protein
VKVLGNVEFPAAVTVVYQVEIDEPTTVRTRLFTLEADGWPFPNLPSPGDAVVIDVALPGLQDEQRGNVTVTTPAPGVRLTAMKVQHVIYRPAGPHAMITLGLDGLAHDPAGQIEALLGAGFEER